MSFLIRADKQRSKVNWHIYENLKFAQKQNMYVRHDQTIHDCATLFIADLFSYFRNIGHGRIQEISWGRVSWQRYQRI